MISFTYKAESSFDKNTDAFLLQLTESITLCSLASAYRQDYH